MSRSWWTRIKGIPCKCNLLNKISGIKQTLSLMGHLGSTCMNGLFKARKENVNNLLFYKVISLMVFLLIWLAVSPRSAPARLGKTDRSCRPIRAQYRQQQPLSFELPDCCGSGGFKWRIEEEKRLKCKRKNDRIQNNTSVTLGLAFFHQMEGRN